MAALTVRVEALLVDMLPELVATCGGIGRH